MLLAQEWTFLSCNLVNLSVKREETPIPWAFSVSCCHYFPTEEEEEGIMHDVNIFLVRRLFT